VSDFLVGVRHRLGGDPFPYVWIPEWHPAGHGLHVHFRVGGYVRKRMIGDAGGRGWSFVLSINGLPAGLARAGGQAASGVAWGYRWGDDLDLSWRNIDLVDRLAGRVRRGRVRLVVRVPVTPTSSLTFERTSGHPALTSVMRSPCGAGRWPCTGAMSGYDSPGGRTGSSRRTGSED
jgi:hypothetical protein